MKKLRWGRPLLSWGYCSALRFTQNPTGISEHELTSSRRGELFIEYEGNDAAGDLTGTFVITGGTGDVAGATAAAP